MLVRRGFFAAVLALFVAACGGGDKGSPSTPTAPSGPNGALAVESVDSTSSRTADGGFEIKVSLDSGKLEGRRSPSPLPTFAV